MKGIEILLNRENEGLIRILFLYENRLVPIVVAEFPSKTSKKREEEVEGNSDKPIQTQTSRVKVRMMTMLVTNGMKNVPNPPLP